MMELDPCPKKLQGKLVGTQREKKRDKFPNHAGTNSFSSNELRTQSANAVWGKRHVQICSITCSFEYIFEYHVHAGRLYHETGLMASQFQLLQVRAVPGTPRGVVRPEKRKKAKNERPIKCFSTSTAKKGFAPSWAACWQAAHDLLRFADSTANRIAQINPSQL